LLKKSNDEQNQGYHQNDVNSASHGVGAHKAQQPEKQQNYRDRVEHLKSFLFSSDALLKQGLCRTPSLQIPRIGPSRQFLKPSFSQSDCRWFSF
jgi:hypothetical protein